VFVHSGHRIVAEYQSGAEPADPERKYVYGEYLDEPVALIDASGQSEAIYHYHANALYSVAALTDSSGAVVERYAYTPYGVPLILDGGGTTVRAVSVYGNRFTFTGREWDHASATYHYRARSYDPVLGRFLGLAEHMPAFGRLPPLRAGRRPAHGVDEVERVPADVFGERQSAAVVDGVPLHSWNGGVISIVRHPANITLNHFG
jgi:RHS repeat-associated protein